MKREGKIDNSCDCSVIDGPAGQVAGS
jgi:hypothetical protein